MFKGSATALSMFLFSLLAASGHVFGQRVPDRIALTFTNQTKASVHLFVDGASRCEVAAQARCELDIVPGTHPYVVRTAGGADLVKVIETKEGSLCLFLRDSGIVADACDVSDPGAGQKVAAYFSNLSGEVMKIFVDNELKCDLYNSLGAECLVNLLPGEHTYVARSSGGYESSERFTIRAGGPGLRISIQRSLSSLVIELQRNPFDRVLRERIIRQALETRPVPAVSEETERFMARGIAAMKDAKSEAGFREAAEEFKKAVASAPWYADAYYNLGIAQSKGRNYEGAVNNLKFYLLAAPEAADAKATKAIIYEVEYQRERIYSRFDNVPFRISSTDRNANAFNGTWAVEGTFEGYVSVRMMDESQRLQIFLNSGSLYALERTEKVVSIKPFLAENSGDAFKIAFVDYPIELNLTLPKRQRHALSVMAFGLDAPPGFDLTNYWLGFEIRMLCADGKPDCTTYAHSSKKLFASR